MRDTRQTWNQSLNGGAQTVRKVGPYGQVLKAGGGEVLRLTPPTEHSLNLQENQLVAKWLVSVTWTL